MNLKASLFLALEQDSWGPWNQVARLLGTVLRQRGVSLFAALAGYLIAAGGYSVRIPSTGGSIVASLLLNPLLVNTLPVFSLL